MDAGEANPQARVVRANPKKSLRVYVCVTTDLRLFDRECGKDTGEFLDDGVSIKLGHGAGRIVSDV